jgi:PAS domain S-box-containing protein
MNGLPMAQPRTRNGRPSRLPVRTRKDNELHSIHERLLQERDQLELITTITPTMLARCSRALRYLFVNRAYALLWDRTPEQVIGKSLRAIQSAGAYKTFRPHIARVIQGHRVEFEVVLDRPHNSTLFLHVVCIPDHDAQGNVAGWVESITDISDRKRFEQALVESEGRFRQVAEAAPVMIWMAGPNRSCSYLNKRWLQFTGQSLEQAQHNGWTSAIHPDDMELCLGVYQRSFEARQPFRIECRLRHHDGKYRWVLDLGVPRYAATDQFAGFIGSCVEITERKQAEDVLRQARNELELHVQERTLELVKTNSTLQSEILEHEKNKLALARLAAIVESSSDAIISVTPNQTVISWNKAAEHLFGFSAKDMIGGSLSQLFICDQLELFQQRHEQILRGQAVAPFDTVLCGLNGRPVDVTLRLSPIKTPSGSVTGVSLIARDISERKRAEAALRASETKFRGFIESAPDAVVIVDEPGQIQLVNAQTELLFGYQREELLGQSLEILMPSRFRRRHAGYRQSYFSAPYTRPMGTELALFGKRKDGSEFPVEISLSPLHTESGDLVCAAIRDITARQQADEELRRSKEHYLALFHEARRAEHRLRMLSSTILQIQEKERKHISLDLHDEVGQALTAISVSLAALRNGGCSGSGPIRQKLDDLQRLLQSAMATVHNFARELRPSILDELGLLPALRSCLSQFAERTGLEVQFNGQSQVEQLGNEEKVVLFRVAQESLTNVAKHAHANKVVISLRKIRNNVCLCVKDNGQSFQESPEGIGKSAQRLGLLGMRERVRLVNGEFNIHPRPGKGTTVRVVIPLKSYAPAKESPDQEPASPEPV